MLSGSRVVAGQTSSDRSDNTTSQRPMHRTNLLLTFASLALFAHPAVGQNCSDDIVLVNGTGCSTPCCTQSPPGSGNYVFKHRQVESIDIRNNPSSVVSVSFPNLESVEKRIRISFNQPGAVTSISFPALRTAGAIEIVDNDGLVSLDLPRLMAIENEDFDAYLRVERNTNLASMNAPLLRSITAIEAGSAYLEISLNQALPDIDLPLFAGDRDLRRLRRSVRIHRRELQRPPGRHGTAESDRRRTGDLVLHRVRHGAAPTTSPCHNWSSCCRAGVRTTSAR